jgi:hypothetical protein
MKHTINKLSNNTQRSTYAVRAAKSVVKSKLNKCLYNGNGTIHGQNN